MSSDPEDTEDPMPPCDLCGAIEVRLHEVADEDRSVGYHGTVLVCDECIERRRGKR